METQLNSNDNVKKEEKPNLDIKEKNISEKPKPNKLPALKIQKISSFPTASYCYFFISIGLFILGCHCAGWCEYGPNFINSVFFFIGICQYILGLYDWYQNNNILCMQNIIFGIWYITFFFNNFEINGLKKANGIFNSVQGASDLVMLFFISNLIIMSKGKGIAYVIDYFLLFFVFSFLALSGYSNDYIIVIKIGGYIYFITFVCFWLTGLSIIINDVFKKKLIKFVEPRIQ